jgi:hypothetical protein
MADWFQEVSGLIVSHDDADQNEPEFQESWQKVPLPIRFGIETGIVLSRKMVSSALHGLEVWSACNAGLQRSATDLKLAAEVDDGLHKYFHLVEQSLKLKQQDRVLQKQGIAVRGIQRVFLQIQEGLKSGGPCEIQLWSFINRSIWAGVLEKGSSKPGTTPSPIRATFGFADEFGHVDWKDMGGPILLSTTWLKRPPEAPDKYSKAEEIARTLVHEASHRFAGTRDILYKAESFGAELKELDTAMAFDRSGAEIVKMEQAKVGPITTRALPPGGAAKPKQWQVGIDKELIGIAPKAGKPSIAVERWLENADSYAFFARRIWKRTK